MPSTSNGLATKAEQDADHNEKVARAQSEITWSVNKDRSGKPVEPQWWGDTMPYANDVGEYIPQTPWTKENASMLAVWQSGVLDDLMLYCRDGSILKTANATLIRRNAIAAMKQETGGRFDLAIYIRMRNHAKQPSDGEVNDLSTYWHEAMRNARRLCERTPTRLYKRGIGPGNAKGRDLAKILVMNDMALAVLLKAEMIREPPPEIQGIMNKWLIQKRKGYKGD